MIITCANWLQDKYVVETYTSILKTPGKDKKTLSKAIATDFCSRDAKGLTEMLHNLFGPSYKCDILQVICILFE